MCHGGGLGTDDGRLPVFVAAVHGDGALSIQVQLMPVAFCPFKVMRGAAGHQHDSRVPTISGRRGSGGSSGAARPPAHGRLVSAVVRVTWCSRCRAGNVILFIPASASAVCVTSGPLRSAPVTNAPPCPAHATHRTGLHAGRCRRRRLVDVKLIAVGLS
jgi:hypothetical protein